MNQRCVCQNSIRQGNFQGVEFLICTNCKYLTWEPQHTRDLISADFELSLTFTPTKSTSIGALLGWLENSLNQLSQTKPKYLINFQAIGLHSGSKEEEEELSLDDKCRLLSSIWNSFGQEFVVMFGIGTSGFEIANRVIDGQLELDGEATDELEKTASQLFKALNQLLVGHGNSAIALKDAEQLIDCFYDFLVSVESGPTEVTIQVPLREDLRVWDIRAAEDEWEEEMYALIASKLGGYSTEDIFKATLEDMWTEMSDYMAKDQARDLAEFIRTLTLDGAPIEVRVAYDLQYVLPLPWDQATVETK